MAFESDKLRIAATDRYRWPNAQQCLKEPVSGTKEVIIPARTINELYKILGTTKGEVGNLFFGKPSFV
jgi:DNA polymerase III sliding clamp (beta) subunit (PCNA family)